MNEVKQYLFLVRKWAWLLILGTFLGGAGAYVFSRYQPTIYETTTKIMVSRSTDPSAAGYYIYNDLQLAKTYAQLIDTGLILENLNKKLGFNVNGNQIEVKQLTDSLLLAITVQDGDPQRAALIANTLVQVFMEYNRDLQNSRFAESEKSLSDQITEVEKNIAVYQGQIESMSANSLEQQKTQASVRIQEIEDQLSGAEDQIISLEKELAAFFPAPLITNTPVPYYYRPTSTPAPVPTPTLNPTEEVRYKELQLRLDQLEDLRTLYKDVYANLLVVDTNENNTDPALTQQQLQTNLTLYQQIYSNLLTSLANVQLEKARSAPNISLVEAAVAPEQPIRPQPLQNSLLGSVAGLMVMAAIAFTVEFMDDTIKNPEDVQQHLHLPVIGMIGEMRSNHGKKMRAKDWKVYVAENPLSPVSEAFRTLRTNLDFAAVDRPLKTLLITSTTPNEGKSTVAVNLAAILAQGERRVILIDTDLRKPTVHRFLTIPNRKGLTDLFRDQAKVANVIATWGNPPFGVITSGSLPPNPTELLDSDKMGRILEELKEKSDIIIADAPPTIVADSIVLAAKMDGVLFIIQPGKTKIGAAQVLMEQMQRAGARVVGVVLNPVAFRRSQYYSKYHYYSQYYSKNGYGSNGRTNGTKNLLDRANGKNGKVVDSEETVVPRKEQDS